MRRKRFFASRGTLHKIGVSCRAGCAMMAIKVMVMMMAMVIVMVRWRWTEAIKAVMAMLVWMRVHASVLVHLQMQVHMPTQT